MSSDPYGPNDKIAFDEEHGIAFNWVPYVVSLKVRVSARSDAGDLAAEAIDLVKAALNENETTRNLNASDFSAISVEAEDAPNGE
jgi:hypothetical protein